MSVTLLINRGSVLIRPTCADNAESYRALRLASLQQHPHVYGADYAERAARPLRTGTTLCSVALLVQPASRLLPQQTTN